MIGPPMVPPNWCWLNSGFAAGPARLLNQLLASKASLRRNSKALPWKRVAARLDLEVDHPAHGAPELGGVGARLELELVEGVHAREDHHRLEPGLVVVDPVEQVVVVAGPLAVRGEGGGGAPGQAARPVDVAAAGANAARDAGDGAGRLTKLRPFRGRLSIVLPSTVTLRSEEEVWTSGVSAWISTASVISPRSSFRSSADLLVHADVDVGERDLLEAAHLARDGVGAGGKRGGGVLALGVRDHAERLTPVPVLTRTTVAPGTTAPDESFTMPRIVPVTDWASTGSVDRHVRPTRTGRTSPRSLAADRNLFILASSTLNCGTRSSPLTPALPPHDVLGGGCLLSRGIPTSRPGFTVLRLDFESD